MTKSKIALASIPGLQSAQGLFGTAAEQTGSIYNETIVDIMVYLYDVLPPEVEPKA